MTQALYVRLTASDNEFLTYPTYGLLEILECGTTGSIIAASFRQAIDGKLGAAVRVSNPKFEYKPSIASVGHSAVADLHARQLAGDESRNYRHKIIEVGNGEVLEVCRSRDEAEMFCKAHGLQVDHNDVYPDKGAVYSHVYPNISTTVLATIYGILCHDESSTDEELIEMFRGFGLTESQARAQTTRRAAARAQAARMAAILKEL